jgi:hypothetical protein
MILGVAQLDLSSTSISTLKASIITFQKDIEKVVATAYAQALTNAYNYKNNNQCLAFVNAGGCIWSANHTDERTYCASCVAVAYSEGAETESLDAITSAGVSLFPLSEGLHVLTDILL